MRGLYHSGGIGENCFFNADLQTDKKDASTSDSPSGSSSGNKLVEKVQAQRKVVANMPRSEQGSVLTGLHGVVWSNNCNVAMNVTTGKIHMDWGKAYMKAVNYAIMMTIVAMAQVGLLLKQLHHSSTQAAAAKLSVIAVGQQAAIDSYTCLLHLTGGIVLQPLFTAFATVAFFKLVIFSIFEMRYLLLIWKARRPQGFNLGWNAVRRELTILYSRFYCTLLVGIMIAYNFWGYLTWLLVVAYSFWIPQIVYNAQKEVRNPLDYRYLVGISVARMVAPLYLYGCPNNFLIVLLPGATSTKPGFCLMLSVWMFLQVAMLMLQDRFGPRFFIPARFLPQKYRYDRRVVSPSSNKEDMECVICINTVEISGNSYMVAPCEHVFHRECLEQWMEVKLECPTCRMELPPL
jgi:hypothetical protein